MTKLFSLLFTFIFTSNALAQDYEFKIMSCESHNRYILKENQFQFESKVFRPIKFDTIISNEDLLILNSEFSKILSKKEDEVWLNYSINDGENLKFILSDGTNSKKVFVGNYYDERLNKIALILNKYLSSIMAGFHVKIPYGTLNEKAIKEFIERQSKSDEAPKEYKENMLNNWCEF